MWTFRFFTNSSERSKVRETYQSTPAIEGAFDATMDYLAVREQRDWVKPYGEKLKPGEDELWAMRFKADNNEQRPIGYFGPDISDFTLVTWAIHKDKYVPPTWSKTAKTNRRLIRDGDATAELVEIDDCDD